MIGLIPNFFAVLSALCSQQSPAPASQSINTRQCPTTRDIRSEPYTDPDIPFPFGDGYQYTVTANGKTWVGQTAGTDDDYLSKEYELQPEQIHERDGRIYCDYGGKTVNKNGVTSTPYLRLSTSK